MCGIAGIVTWSEKFRVQRETLNAISARIAHRGPDAQGIWLSSEAPITAEQPQIALIHRRLAILDLDPRANQPFTDNRGRWIVFNGEIYNFVELRRELGALKPDYNWRTTCDTEVLLCAYDTWGDRCVEHLSGMFAFVIWDPHGSQLFSAVDRMGQKPLYWAASSGGEALAFASELEALRQVPWVNSQLNPIALTMYLQSGYVPAPWTIYKDVFKLPPATAGRLAPGKPQLAKYFDSTAFSKPSPDGQATSATSRRVRHAVEQQLVSDVPVGCFLSGGVDSSVIAAAMTGIAAGNRVQTFTIGFDDPLYDETSFAAAVAKHLGTDHHEFIVRPNAAEDLPALAKVFGEPFADSSALPTHYLARETKRFVKVALSGDGGDELFGGYDRYRAVQIAGRLHRTGLGARAMHPLWNCLPGTHPKSRGARAKRLLHSLSLPPAERYLSYLDLFDAQRIDELLGVDAGSGDLPQRQFLRETYDHLSRYTDCVRAALAIDRISYLPGDLLVKLDRASMLHALEVRSPFMDHELVSFAASLSTKQLLQGGSKCMLREAFAGDLPAWVFTRKKMGFAVPIGRWFRGELRPMLRDSLFASDSLASQWFKKPAIEKLIEEHEQQTADHSQRLYSLLMLELWSRLNSSPRSA
jgi:asparagine synthase (glutamine-hydrolysing)